MHGIMSRVKGVFVVKRQLEGPESRSLTPDDRRKNENLAGETLAATRRGTASEPRNVGI